MQRKAVFSYVWTMALVALVAGCGGGGSKAPASVPTTITITPSILSLESGKFATLTATVKDQNGNALTGQTITWSTSNANIVDVTPSTAAVCGGTWNSTTAPTVCQPKAPGSADITATSGSISAKITVTVFPHVSRVVVNAPSSICISQNETQQFTAQAFDSSNNPITVTPQNFTWSSGDSTVVTVDGNGVVTGKRPGGTTITATLTSTVGIPQHVTTCPPKYITIATQNVTPPEANFTLAAGGSKTLAATITDIKGNPITDFPLTYSSLNTGIATVTGSALTASVSAGSPGTTTVIASCLPPGCNPGANQPYYSNPVTVTVSGASASKTIVGGTTATGVVVIDSTGTATAPIPFAAINGATPVANSMVMSPDGNIAYIGTNLGVLRFDASANTFLSPIVAFTGKVLAVSPNGRRVLATDGGSLFVFDAQTGNVISFVQSGITAADFATDSSKAYAVAGSTLITYLDGATSVTKTSLSSAAPDLKFLPQSSVAFAAEGGSSDVIANCTNAIVGAPGAMGTTLGKAGYSWRFWGADSSNIYQVDITGDFVAHSTPTSIDCTEVAIATPTVVAASPGTPAQVVSSFDASRVFVVGGSKIVAFTASGSATTLTTGSSILSAAVLPDGASLLAGNADSTVTKFAVPGYTVQSTITTNLKKGDGSAAPIDLMAVRPK